MILKVLTFILLFSLFTPSKDNDKHQSGIIRLMYTGDYSKPWPVIILHLPNTIDTAVIDTWKLEFEVTENGLEQVSKSIQMNNVNLDSTLASPYRFEIINNGETNIFLTPYLTRVRQVFQAIINQLGDLDKKYAETEFSNILIRLKIVSKLSSNR